MNKVEALEKSIKLWKYIKKNGVKKIEAYYALELKPDLASCPLCQYTSEVSDSGNLTCRLCPVWPQDDGPRSGCEHEESPYFKWERANFCSKLYDEDDYLTEAKKYAGEMVALLQTTLDKEQNREQETSN